MPFAMRQSGWLGMLALAIATAVFCVSGKLIVRNFEKMPPDVAHTYPALGAGRLLSAPLHLLPPRGAHVPGGQAMGFSTEYLLCMLPALSQVDTVRNFERCICPMACRHQPKLPQHRGKECQSTRQLHVQAGSS
jgi:hypothetical protein